MRAIHDFSGSDAGGAPASAAPPILPDRRRTMTCTDTSAQDPNEPFDVVRADGTPTGQVKARAAVHRDGDWHRAIHVWVAGRDARGSPFLTFQRRSSRKDTWPGRLDATVGGHYRAGEMLAETLREVEEELGVPATMRDLRPLGVRIWANETERGIVDREIQEVFLWRNDRPLAVFTPNPAELASLARFPLDDLLPLLSGEAAELHGESYTPGASRAEPCTVRPEDFIPTIDRYFLRVAIAARSALRGERYVAI
jgi:isopentenyldiphosphate isomerase